jgi:thiamine transport system ATP-binding protein
MLEVDGLSVVLGDREVVRDVSFSVARGDVLALLGPSGCGKTTVLRAVAGLESVARGSVRLDGRDLDGEPPNRRDVGLMFQDYALFPHRDVRANVEFGLRMHRVPRPEREQRVAEVLEMVGLVDLAGRSVSELSGGERQRVALARSLAPRPRVLMLDEPLASLDRSRRDQLLDDLAEVFDAARLAVVYVTHDQTEALALADQVVVMERGQVLQAAPPAELWSHPASPSVARFLGFANVFDVDVVDGNVIATFGVIAHRVDQPDGPAVALVRPSAVHVEPAARDVASRLGPATVRRVAFAGERSNVEVALGDGSVLEAHVTGPPPADSSVVALEIDPVGVQLFAPTPE